MHSRYAMAAFCLLAVFTHMGGVPAAAQSPAPKVIPFQGRLTDPSGAPKPDGAYTVVFRLYNDADLFTPVWSDAKTVQVKGGLFATTLGDTPGKPLPLDQFKNALSLGIQAGQNGTLDAEMSPRLPLSAAAHALFADTVPDGAITNDKIVSVDYSKITNAPTGSGATGPAGGDLTGTYPNPTVVSDGSLLPKVSGNRLTNTTAWLLDQAQQYSVGTQSGTFWQSFTPSRTADLVALELWIGASGQETPVTVQFYSGEGTSGTLLGSATLTVGLTMTWQRFVLNAPIALTAGQKYTFTVTTPANVLVARNTADVYPNGTANVGGDLCFITYMSNGNAITLNGGLGLNVSQPQATLDVNGNINVGQSRLLSGLTTEVVGGNPLLNLDVNFRHPGGKVAGLGAAFRIDSRPNLPLFQWIYRQAGTSTDKVVGVLTSTGQMGIGTDVPLTALHMPETGLQIGTNTVATENFYIRSTSSPSRGLRFYNGNAGGGQEKMVLLANGNVGIGVNNPGNGLVIANPGGPGANLPNGVSLGIDTANNAHVELVANGGSPYIDFNNDNTSDNKARIILEGGNTLSLYAPTIKANGAVVQTSDARFKINIRPLSGALDTVLALQGVSFDWRRDEFPAMHFPETRQVGFIAQDVEKVLPEVVATDSNGYKAVAYQNVVPVLVEAVKELKSENDRKDAQIEALRRQNARTEERLRHLEQSLAGR